MGHRTTSSTVPDTPLWKAIDGLVLDDPEASMPFTHRLARDHNWDLAYAKRVVAEYKRFLYLAATGDQPCTPSEDVDEAWHLHMVYTRSYWDDLCGNVLGKPLHHTPTCGAENTGMYKEAYAATLARYHDVFGGRIDRKVWPSVSKRFATNGGAKYATVSLEDHTIFKTSTVLLGAALGLTALLWCWYKLMVVGAVSTMVFFSPFLAIAAAIALFGAVETAQAKKGKKESGGGCAAAAGCGGGGCGGGCGG